MSQGLFRSNIGRLVASPAFSKRKGPHKNWLPDFRKDGIHESLIPLQAARSSYPPSTTLGIYKADKEIREDVRIGM
jgi:hypothetical protein